MGKKSSNFFGFLSQQGKAKCFLFLFQLLTIVSFAQTSITGTVRDENGMVMQGATINVVGSNEITTSDAKGLFTISAAKDAVLEISFTGFTTVKIPVQSRTNIDVVLKVGVNTLDAVVLTGYGSQSRQTVTSSISKLDTKVLKDVPYQNVGSALQGTVSGVRVQSVGGSQPGAAPRIIVRGGTSINDLDGSSPLYSIDGVIRDNLNDINPADIESIQVLKDAAATVIYGARGANGVVLITTKSGKAGRSTVTYNYSLSVSELRNIYPIVSAKDQIYFQRLGIVASNGGTPHSYLETPTDGGTGNDLTNNTAYTTQYLTPENQHKLQEGWQSMQDPVYPDRTIIFKETDFQDVLFQTGLTNNHNITVSGGNEKATFSTTVGYMDVKGVAITTDYKRLSLNSSGSLKINDKLNAFARLQFTNSEDRKTYNDNVFFGRFIMAPKTTKYMFEDGTLAPGANQRLGNALYHLSKQNNRNIHDKYTVVVGANWKILPGLTFDPQVSLYQAIENSRAFTMASFTDGPTFLNTTRPVSAEHYKFTQKQVDAVFSYNKKFKGLHNLDAKLGYSFFDRSYLHLSGSGRGAATDNIPTLNAAAVPLRVNGGESQLIVGGYFARVNYDYDQKYLLSLTGRYDGASNLGADHKWGFFPGVSAGWNVHKENFWQDFIPNNGVTLKLRASLGTNGNIGNLSDYQAQGVYAANIRYGGEGGIQNAILANSKLKWESTKTLDLGADIGLFNGRVNILFDVYRKVTDNLITSLQLPMSTGFGAIAGNLGSLENKGLELELNTNIFEPAKAFQWNVGVNASIVKNKILKLPNNGQEDNRVWGYYVWDPAKQDYGWLGGIAEGQRLGDLFAWRQLGVYATDEEAAQAPVDMMIPQADKTKYGGDVNWDDIDKNGIIDDKDRVLIGNIYPRWTGGLMSFMTYKNISLNVRMDYATGFWIYNYVRALTLGQMSGIHGLHQDVLKSWQKQGDVTDIPRFYMDDSGVRNNISRGNSAFHERGDYLALREVTLSYSLPKTLVQRLRVQNIALNLSGHNLHYFTAFSGLNPEVGENDLGRYPITRNFIFGARVTF